MIIIDIPIKILGAVYVYIIAFVTYFISVLGRYTSAGTAVHQLMLSGHHLVVMITIHVLATQNDQE